MAGVRDSKASAREARRGAAAAVREVTEGLQVYPEKMLENLNATGGLLLAENVIHLSTNSGVSHRRHLIIRELRSMKSRRGMALNVVDANGHFHLGAPPLSDNDGRPSPWNEQR